MKAVGVEIDPVRDWIAKLQAKRNRVSANVTFLKQNLFAVDISPAAVVYVYLIPRVLLKLQTKFMTELKPGTRVVSYRYEIPYLPEIAFNKEQLIHVYEIPKKGKR